VAWEIAASQLSDLRPIGRVGSTAREAAMAASRNNVRKRGSTWTYYAYVTDGAGNRRQISKGGFVTRREAEAARVEALAAMANGSWVRPERLNVREFLVDEWLPTQRPPTLEESTYVGYARNVELHVVPYIGGIALQQLTPMDLNALYRKLLESGRRPQGTPPRQHDPGTVALIEDLHGRGLTWQQVADEVSHRAPELAGITRHAVASIHRRTRDPKPAKQPVPGLNNRSVRYVHTIIHAALRDALRWNRVNRNAADAATPPPQGSTRRGRQTTWTSEQLGRFLDFVADSPYLPAWLFLATSGSRRGEMLGLQWHDLDLDAATAIMSRQVTMVDHRVVVKELPKTKAGHTILLDPATVEMLHRHRATQGELKRLLGAGYHDNGWVFCRADGATFHPERFSRQFLRKQETYNAAHADEPLPRLKLHGLRHTWATLALQEGIDIHVVSDRLNHSSTHITSEIYTHVTRPMQSDAADRVAARIFAPTELQ
jgi:integrase